MLVFFALLSFSSIAASQYGGVGSSISDFAFEFYKQCANTNSGDIVISPLSVASALALISQAANGTTYEQIRRGLHLVGDKSSIANQYHELLDSLQKTAATSTLTIANQIYIQRGEQINDDFSKIAKEKFLSGIESLNFADKPQSVQIINDFVKRKTNDKIRDFVNEDVIDVDAKTFLVNAIYFNSNWQTKFNKELTKTGDFFIGEHETVPVDYMHMTNNEQMEYSYSLELKAAMVEMKYANPRFAFVIVLPDNRTGLADLEAKFTQNHFNSMINDMNLNEVNISMPKFKVGFQINLKDALTKLGMNEMFGSKADFGGLLKSAAPLQVSDVLHKAVIEVNEDGSEAAAATGVQVVFRSYTSPENFFVDHPFLYFIRDTEKNAIIFSGRVENFKPQAARLVTQSGSSSNYNVSALFLVFTLLAWAIYSWITS